MERIEMHKGMNCLLLNGRPLQGDRAAVISKLIAAGYRDPHALYERLMDLGPSLIWGYTIEKFLELFNSCVEPLDADDGDGDGLSATSRARRGD